MDNRHRAPFPTSFPDSKARRKDVSLSSRVPGSVEILAKPTGRRKNEVLKKKQKKTHRDLKPRHRSTTTKTGPHLARLGQQGRALGLCAPPARKRKRRRRTRGKDGSGSRRGGGRARKCRRGLPRGRCLGGRRAPAVAAAAAALRSPQAPPRPRRRVFPLRALLGACFRRDGL